MSEGVSTQPLRQFDRALRAYLRYNRRETGPLLEDRGKKLQWELYRQFKAIATTRDKIEQEAASVGYAIRRRMGANGKRLSVKKELALRKRSIRYLSVSYLFRAWKSRREGQSGSFSATSRRNKQIGEALIRTSKGKRRPFVRLTSFLEGVVAQNRQRRLVDKALRAQSADMKTYVQRKQREQVRRTIGRIFR
ncbi:MAG: hypothetical protein V2I43_26655 [Parvularcula sp.]|nr:hypothetical protein [Parvularcula sp.]